MDQSIKNETWIEERKRLFKTPQHELSPADQYQRMRYEREIEGDEYKKLLQLGFSCKKSAIQGRKNADEIVKGIQNCST